MPLTTIGQARTLVDRLWANYSGLQDLNIKSIVEEMHQNMTTDRSAYDTPAEADKTALDDFNTQQKVIADECLGQ